MGPIRLGRKASPDMGAGGASSSLGDMMVASFGPNDVDAGSTGALGGGERSPDAGGGPGVTGAGDGGLVTGGVTGAGGGVVADGGGVVFGAAGPEGIAGGIGSSSGPAWAQAPRGKAEDSRIAVR